MLTRPSMLDQPLPITPVPEDMTKGLSVPAMASVIALIAAQSILMASEYGTLPSCKKAVWTTPSAAGIKAYSL